MKILKKWRFESIDEPKRGRCSICHKWPRGKMVREIRGTGSAGNLQIWWYCLTCWREHQAYRGGDTVYIPRPKRCYP